MCPDSEATDSSSFVKLAVDAVRSYVVTGETLRVPDPIPEDMQCQAGVFVSIKKRGRLRGCIGTFAPTEPTVAHEIIANAIKSASSDPRFPPIAAFELEDLTISVDVLGEPEACEESELDPSHFGVIVESGWKRGLLLPDLEGVDTVEQQLDIARSKAGILPHESMRLFRFTVRRYT
jgi:AmmeMemoRadiSam system protein A